MAESGTVTRALPAIVADRRDDKALAERICQACVAGLDVDGAAISLLTATAARETLWATDAPAELLEELQFTLNEGACIEAAVSGSPVLVPDLRHATETARWPMFAAAVAEQSHIGALFPLPLQWGAVNATDALARMRAYAFVEQRLLIDVARDVVARRLTFTLDMG